MQMYAEVVDNEIIEISSRPTWYYPIDHSDYPGEEITDDSIYIQGGLNPDENAACWCPVSNEEKPSYDPETEYAPKQKSQSEWEIKSDRVIRTWYASEAKSLSTVQEETCNDVNGECSRRVSQGISYTFPDGSTGTIQLRNNDDAINVLGLAAGGLALVVEGDTSTTTPFRDEQNVIHEMTGPEFVEMGEVGRKWKQNNIKAAWQHKDEIRAYTIVEDVQNHDMTLYWP